jgi:hypothetical protein
MRSKSTANGSDATGESESEFEFEFRGTPRSPQSRKFREGSVSGFSSLVSRPCGGAL